MSAWLGSPASYAPPAPRNDIKVTGESGYSMLKLGAWSARQGDYISDYDVVIAEKLANVLSGGRLTHESLHKLCLPPCNT